jgi:hypothetical protein
MYGANVSGCKSARYHPRNWRSALRTDASSFEIKPRTARITRPISPSLWPIWIPFSAPSTRTSFNSLRASFLTPALWWCRFTSTSSSVRPRFEVGICEDAASSWSLRDLSSGFCEGRAIAAWDVSLPYTTTRRIGKEGRTSSLVRRIRCIIRSLFPLAELELCLLLTAR